MSFKLRHNSAISTDEDKVRGLGLNLSSPALFTMFETSPTFICCLLCKLEFLLMRYNYQLLINKYQKLIASVSKKNIHDLWDQQLLWNTCPNHLTIVWIVQVFVIFVQDENTVKLETFEHFFYKLYTEETRRGLLDKQHFVNTKEIQQKYRNFWDLFK